MAQEVISSSPQRTHSPPPYPQAPRYSHPDPWEYHSTTQLPFGFIDLTAESSPPSPRTAASGSRSREIPESPPAAKRRRVDHDEKPSDRSHPLPSGPSVIRDIEEVDLRDVDDNPGLLSTLLAQQHADTIKNQIEQSNKPLRLTTKQCVICMENMTNMTATHCGKPFLYSPQNSTTNPPSIPRSPLLSHLHPRSSHRRRKPRSGARKRTVAMSHLPQKSHKGQRRQRSEASRPVGTKVET